MNRTILAFVFAFLITACASPPIVGVNSIATKNFSLQSQTFVVIPNEPGVSETDLQFVEYAGVIGRALEKRGLKAVTRADDPDMAILLNYATGDRYQSGSAIIAVPNTDNYVVKQYSSVPMGFRLLAIDYDEFRSTAAIKQLFDTFVTISTNSGDLRVWFPSMTATALPLIGTDTGGFVNLTAILNGDKINEIVGE
jgi:hypothetical protein